MGRPQFFTIDRTHQLAKGLVFAGLGNAPGSNRYDDSSPYGNHGVLTNMESVMNWAGTSIGRMRLFFGGTNKYVNFTNRPIFPSLNNWSISFWCIDTTIASNSSWFISEMYVWAGTEHHGVSIRRYDSGLYCMSCQSGTTAAYYKASGIFSVNELLHLCIVCPGTSAFSVYKNGVLQTGFSNSGIYDKPQQTTNSITLGRVSTSASNYENYMTASLSDVLIHGRMLNGAEIKQLADPSNFMLSGMIRPIGSESSIYDREGIR